MGIGWLDHLIWMAVQCALSSQVAGPSVVLTWIIGDAAVALLALVHAELGGMFAVSGGTARFTHYALGSIGGFTMGWATWLAGVTSVPIEVEAMLDVQATMWIGYSLDWGSGLAFWSRRGTGGRSVVLVMVINLDGSNSCPGLTGRSPYGRSHYYFDHRRPRYEFP